MARITIDLPDSLHRELKKSAATLRISIHELALQRIEAAPVHFEKTQNRWANLVEELKVGGTIDGLAKQITDNKAELSEKSSSE